MFPIPIMWLLEALSIHNLLCCSFWTLMHGWVVTVYFFWSAFFILVTLVSFIRSSLFPHITNLFLLVLIKNLYSSKYHIIIVGLDLITYCFLGYYFAHHFSVPIFAVLQIIGTGFFILLASWQIYTSVFYSITFLKHSMQQLPSFFRFLC